MDQMRLLAVRTRYELPHYWERLSEDDQRQYIQLRHELSSPIYSNQRGRSCAQFGSILDMVKSYVVRGNKADVTRALVCGICWLKGSIAVNVQQLQLLTSKCKSSINGSLCKLGYGAAPPRDRTARMLIATFPWMKDSHSEFRSWTIRQRPPAKCADPTEVYGIMALLKHSD
jgi:hypothetical protein